MLRREYLLSYKVGSWERVQKALSEDVFAWNMKKKTIQGGHDQKYNINH